MNKKFFCIFIFSILTLSSCKVSTKTSLQEEFKDDSYFFLGLQAADENDTEKAIRYFKISRDSETGTEIISRRSAENLILLGNVIERNEAALFLANKYKDDNAFLLASRELFKQNEFASIIKITDNIDLKTAPNELVKLRFDAMMEKKDSRFEHEYFIWVVSRPLSTEHLEFYQKYLANKIKSFQEKQSQINDEYQKQLQKRIEEWKKDWKDKNPDTELDENIVPKEFEDLKLEILELPVTDEQKIINYRVFVYHKDYKEAFRTYKDILKIYEDNTPENSTIVIEEQILSDLGKTLLYGTNNYYSSARELDNLAKKLEPEEAYYTYFYAARLYDKGGRYQKTATTRFRSALEATKNNEKFDNALWYLLNFQLRTSTSEIITTLKTYGSSIHNPEYFDDFFESLSVLLLSGQKWQDFYEVWKETNSNFSQETDGKYAYISGRLIEEGLAKGAEGLKTRQSVDAFMKVISGKGRLYYKVCALERLNINDKDLVDLVLLNKKREYDKQDAEENEESNSADKLMQGYSSFGFPQRIYTEWLLNRENISTETSFLVSKFLFDCGQFNSNYNIQSLRIASRAKLSAEGKLSKEFLNLVYPRFYAEFVKKACLENEIPEYLLYSLVRTESFFDASISSVAGAVGLTQLMESTANDEAKKLKLDDNFDILDPETNLRMGSHYLKSLITRVETNSPLLALFAYNGGLTNVRKWLKASKKDWATLGKSVHQPAGISLDLFLETLPFTETRDYGRKLIETATMYGWLYYEKEPTQTVREILYANQF